MVGSTDKSCSITEHIDPRVRRTRKLLQDAFRTLILTKQYSEISVQDIAEQATVNRATFYAHYIDKHDLAASVLKTELRKAVLQRFPAPPPFTHENLVQLAAAMFEFMDHFHGSCPETRAELQDTVVTTLQQGIYEIIEGWISTSNTYLRLFPGCAKETVVTVISWSIYGGASNWRRSENRRSAASVCEELVSMLLPLSKTPVAITAY